MAMMKIVERNKMSKDIKISSILWIKAQDQFYYDFEIMFKLLSSDYGNKINIVFYPEEDEIIKTIKNNQKTDNKLVFVAPYNPPIIFKNHFIIKEFGNKFDILTSQEKEENFSATAMLEKRLGVSVINSKLSFKDLGGAKVLKEWVTNLLKAEKQGYKPKGLFLVGIPGTGKTFFPNCLAGELNRPLIMLNLAQIKESAEPIATINRIFSHLDKVGQKTIILLDEVEKMVGNADDPVTGRIMTILNDINSGGGGEYPHLDCLVFATANSLDSIIKNQPAFLRRGRFDELFFVNLPTTETTEEIFKIYFNKYRLTFIENIISIRKIINRMSNTYKDARVDNNRFCYTHSEIQSFCYKLYFYKISGIEITTELIEDTIKQFIPLIKTGREGIQRIIGQKELFIEI